MTVSNKVKKMYSQKHLEKRISFHQYMVPFKCSWKNRETDKKYTHKWADARSSSEDTLLSDSKGAPCLHSSSLWLIHHCSAFINESEILFTDRIFCPEQTPCLAVSANPQSYRSIRIASLCYSALFIAHSLLLCTVKIQGERENGGKWAKSI